MTATQQKPVPGIGDPSDLAWNGSDPSPSLIAVMKAIYTREVTAVVDTIADGADVAEGATTDVVVAAGAAGSLSAKLRRLTTDLGALLAQIPATLGQKAMAASLPVVLPSDQSAVATKAADGVNVTQGALTDAAATDSTSSWSLVALLKGLYAKLAGTLTVGGSIGSVSTEFTRPADTTAYTAGDMVSDSTSATTIQTLTNVARVSGGSGYVVGARLSTDKKSITPRFRVHLFNATGATVANDNAAYESLYADIGKRVGYFDLPAMATPADTTNSTESRAIDMTIRIPFVTVASRNLYYVLEALDAFTPASGEKFTLVLVADLN